MMADVTHAVRTPKRWNPGAWGISIAILVLLALFAADISRQVARKTCWRVRLKGTRRG